MAGRTRLTDGVEDDLRDDGVTPDVENSGYNADVDEQEPFSVEDPGGKDHHYDSQSFYHIFKHTSAIVIVIVVVTFGKYIFVTGTAFASTRLARNTCSTGATGIRSPKSRLSSPSAVVSFPRS